MTAEATLFLQRARVGVPETGRLIPARGHELPGVADPHGAVDLVGVALEVADQLAGLHVPELGDVVVAAGEDLFLVRRKYGDPHPLGVAVLAAESVHSPPGVGLPEDRGGVLAAGQDPV